MCTHCEYILTNKRNFCHTHLIYLTYQLAISYRQEPRNQKTGVFVAHLDVFCDAAEHLNCHLDRPREAVLAGLVNGVLARVVPVEIHDGFLVVNRKH